MKKIKHNVPLIMQMEALECGAACVDMILAYYKKWVSLSEIRSTMGISRDGTTIKSVIDGAKHYDLDCKAYRIYANHFKEKVTLPCVAFINNSHFVVVTGFSNKYVYVNNPARGKEKYTWEDFEKHYSNIVLLFEKSPNFKPEGKKTSIISFAKKRLRGAKVIMSFIVIAGLLLAIVQAINPKFSQFFIDIVLGEQNYGLLKPILGILLILALMQFAVSCAQASYLNYSNGRFDIESNVNFVGKILRLPMRFFSQRMSGDLMLRQTSNAQITNTLVCTVAPMVVNAISLIVYAVIMFRTNIPIALLGIFTTILNICIAFYISNKKIEIFQVIARDVGSLSGVTSGILTTIETLMAGGAEKEYFRIWTGEQSALLSGKTRAANVDSYLGSIPAILITLTNAVVLIVGVILIMFGQFSAGALVAMQSLISLFFAPAQTLVSSSQVIQEMQTDMERVEDVFQYDDDEIFSKASKDQKLKRIENNIKLKDVTFGYNTQKDPLLKDLCIDLTKGKAVALVGGSGSGKSTIAKLVAGLYQPWSGSITYDGEPIFAYNRNAFSKSISVVDQDIIFFEGTIYDCLKFGNHGVTQQDIEQGAKDAQIHEAITKRDKGYLYKVTPGAPEFSGGQKQQLEIARALAGNPSILILDEATSALDAKTEDLVMEAIKKRGITTLIIAHRLSTIRNADEIIVLDKGNVVERGNHESLMKNKLTYYNLVKSN